MDQSLLVFITVVEKKSFTRAADALHMTQPAVSQYIQLLEKNVGATLLDRSNKYVQLNKAGEIVYHHANEIIGLYTQMQRLIDDTMNKASGNLSIGASYTFGEYVLPHVVAYLKKQYPLIKPKITIANTKRISEWVANRQLDIGIVDGEIQHNHLPMEAFADDLMYIVASNHSCINQNTRKITDLKNETWIVREETSGTREATEKMFAELNFYPKNIMEFGSTQIIKESVQAGLGITFLSHCTIQKEISLGFLKIIDVIGTPFHRKFSLITPPTQFKTKATIVLMDILKNQIGLPNFFGKPI
ncbi:HTH-type transcriptional regulator CysL [bioreactor metagenome]|uniref:HTH-type transcriptional regulator CysL n=1 Tax=bioreactor metagenome TaxID=1076179 RepID=A0A644SUQ1_9ZZZZ|nr:LysR family transcriptional regulator [Negativicutes bacterium]